MTLTRRRVLAAALLVLVPLLLHWPDLTGYLSESPLFVLSGLAQGMGPGHGVLTGYPGWIDGNAGVTTQALGGLAAQDWLHFRVPWWNPYSGVGLPLAAEMQNSAFFLPFVLLLGSLHGFVVLKIVLQVVAGCSTYALLRECHLSRRVALTCAMCFELNGSFAWFGHGPIMPIAFLPMLLFGIERGCRDPVLGAIWVALGVGWSLLAGFPETAYLDGLLAGAWWLVRLASAPRKRPYAATVIGGGLIGLALAAPPLLAFVQSLPISFVGSHGDLSGAAFQPVNLALLLLPYLLGVPLYGGLHLTGPAGIEQFNVWYRTAGYLDLALLPLAVAGAVARGLAGLGARGIRLLLGAWIVLCLARAAGLPGISRLVNLVPLVGNTMFDLYCVPSCQMAVTILAAFALEDWLAGRLPRRRLAICAGAVGLVALACLPGAWPEMMRLRAVAGYGWYPVLTLAGAGALLLVLVPLHPRVLPPLLVAQAALLFFLPLLAGTPRPRGIDWPAIDFLRRQPGMIRVASIGSLGPNYGALFGIAAIDHNYLPVPQNWVDDVRAQLRPGMDGINNFSTSTDATALAALKARLPALSDHGVGLLLLPAHIDPFNAVVAPALIAADDRAFALRPGAPLDGSIGGLQDGAIDTVTVDIGTYGGKAGGALGLLLCQGLACATGTAPLAGAADNADLAIPLTIPLMVRHDLPVRFSLAVRALPGVAVWLWPRADGGGSAPRITLRFAPAPGSPGLVYADATVAIYRLPGTAAYFEAPGCALSPRSRLELLADCPAPARLLRRELSYPGWRANGVKVEAAGLYQSVKLPAGRTHISFAYAPPHIAWAWAASALGLLALLGLGVRSSGRRAMMGRST